MKKPFITILLILMATLAMRGADIESPLDTRFEEIVSLQTLKPIDVDWLKKESESNGINQCVSIALLFRFQNEETEFYKYFKIDKSSETKKLNNEEVNKEVNDTIQTFKGRSKMELMARLYLHFKESHKTNIRPNGEEMYLETMFRAAFFASSLNSTKEELLKLSSKIDYNN